MPDPYKILTDAIAAVPAMKYALGVAGIAAVLGIVRTVIRIGWKVAVFGTVIMLGMMVLLVVFARYTEMADPSIRYAVVVLTWSMPAFCSRGLSALYLGLFRMAQKF